MNFTLLKNASFLKKLGMFSSKGEERPHQQMVAQRDWIRILVGSGIIGLAITIQSIFVFLDANTEKASDAFGEVQNNKQTDIFDRQDLRDIQTFFQSRQNQWQYNNSSSNCFLSVKS